MPNRLENAASGVLGSLKSAKARIQGLTGVFAQLSREHGEVTALLYRVKASSDPKVRQEFFPKIRTELLAHEEGELAEVYPAFRRDERLARYAVEHEAEAQELERQILVISRTDYGDPSWPQLFSQLVERVSQHVKEEEGTFFPAANRVLGREESERILTRYDLAKTNAMKGALR